MKLHVSIILVLTAFFILNMTDNSSLKKTLINNNYNYIAINEILMWLSNNGRGSHDPNTDGNGLYWPGGKDATQASVFLDGLVWGGFIGDSLHVGGSSWRSGLQPGKILSNGTADNPDLPKYRIYKIRNDWESLPHGPERNAYELDYYEWPVEDGAPWLDIDGDSIYTSGIDEPEIIGDEMLWYVCNDIDSAKCNFAFGSFPIGFEIQVTTYAYKPEWLLDDVIFKKYLIINKSESTVENMILSFWVDHDLGDATDDYVGGDSLLGLGFGYNGSNQDGNGTGITYGTPPPAIGYHLLQGPIIESSNNDSAFYRGKWQSGYKNLPMTSFAPIVKHWLSGTTDPAMGPGADGKQLYNNMRGLVTWTGLPVVDPNTGDSTTFALCGDPVAGIGWYEGPGWPNGEWAYDRRMQINSGPFTFAPGDTNEVVFAIIMAIGNDYLDSVTELKNNVRAIREFYYTGIMSGIDGEPSAGPVQYSLHQNYPNPFNPKTIINYELQITNDIDLSIYNVLGQKVATLVSQNQNAGYHQVEWDASGFASGVYFYQIRAGQFQDVKKMVIIK